MKAAEIKIGGRYTAKVLCYVNGEVIAKWVAVHVDAIREVTGPFPSFVYNVTSNDGRKLIFRSPQRFRKRLDNASIERNQ